MNQKSLLLAASFVAVLFTGAARADDVEATKYECPANPATATAIETDFGPGALSETRCLQDRQFVKVVYGIGQDCTASNSTDCVNKPFGFRNIANAVKDYENAYGMQRYRDYEIVAVVFGSGPKMLRKDSPSAPFIQDLIAKGVKVYMCQNSARALIKAGYFQEGDVVNETIPGVKFVTSGVTAIADFQSIGYSYVDPY